MDELEGSLFSELVTYYELLREEGYDNTRIKTVHLTLFRLLFVNFDYS